MFTGNGLRFTISRYSSSLLPEIGLNMMLVECGDDVNAVDCGLMFAHDELPGNDYVIPHFSYALAKREGFRGVVRAGEVAST